MKFVFSSTTMTCTVALLILMGQATTAASFRVDQKEVRASRILQVQGNVSKGNMTSAATGNVTSNNTKKAILKVLRTKNVELTWASKMDNPWIDAVECHEYDNADCTCGNWGRWYPDGFAPKGCVVNTLAAIYALAKFVDGHGYTVELTGGSLLGAMRCGSFIPWDYDGDMVVTTPTGTDAWDLSSKINNWAGGWQKPASIFVSVDGRNTQPWRSTSGTTSHGNLHLGIYVSDGGGRLPPRALPPTLIPCVMGDIVVHCPADYDAVLTKKYGSDWKSVPKRWETHGTKLTDSPLHLDVAKVDACKDRMSAINTALANMNL